MISFIIFIVSTREPTGPMITFEPTLVFEIELSKFWKLFCSSLWDLSLILVWNWLLLWLFNWLWLLFCIPLMLLVWIISLAFFKSFSVIILFSFSSLSIFSRRNCFSSSCCLISASLSFVARLILSSKPEISLSTICAAFKASSNCLLRVSVFSSIFG